MESLLNSVTPGDVELTLPYSETLNDLINYNSELTNSPTLSSPSPSQGTTHLDISHKLPTKLSKNPSTYEKELRTLVLNLYSDKNITIVEPISSDDMLTSAQDSMVQGPQTKGAPCGVHQKASVPQPLDMMHVTMPQQDLLESGSLGHYSLDNGRGEFEEIDTQNPQKLQGYLVNFQRSKKELSCRHISLSSDHVNQPFDDYGVHLEFAETTETDISEVDGGETVTDGKRELAVNSHKFSDIMTESRGPPLSVKEEGVESEGNVYLVPGIDFKSFGKHWSDSVTKGLKFEETTLNGVDVNKSGLDHEESADLETTGDEVKASSLAGKDYGEFALQRASLEGKLQSLQEELANVLEDRKSLQIRLQAVETRLRKEVHKVRETNPVAVSLVEELKRNKHELESQLVKLQSAYEEKHGGQNEALEQLKRSYVTIQNLKQKLSLVEGEINQREEMVGSLQIEMENLKKLLEKAKEKNDKFKKENMDLNAEIARLVDVKEWLQKQLGFAQEARTKLQLEVSESETIVAAKNQLIEQLRCEGARSSRQLTELQQSSLLEKAQILKHMEQVEEDITRQNFAFKEAEIEKQKMQNVLEAKVDSLVNENKKLLELMSSAVEIEKELDVAKQDLVSKQALLETIIKEKEKIREQLKLARDSTEEYKQNLHELESKFTETKQELKVAQDDIGEKQSFIEKLQEEKRILKENLEVANKEREACDNAIHTLKLDLEKVDRRFKLMKRELTSKTSQLEETTLQKDVFMGELCTLREGLENQVAVAYALKEELAQKDKLLQHFQGVKDALEKEIISLTQKLEYSQGEITQVDKEKGEIQKQLETAKRDNVLLEEKFHKSQLERARLEGEVETTRQSDQLEKDALKSQNASLRDEIRTQKTQLQADVMKEHDKVINLEQELKYLTDEIIRKEGKYNKDLQAFEEKLQEMKKNEKLAEKELKKLHDVTEERVDKLRKSYEAELENGKSDLVTLQQEKSKMAQEFELFQKKVTNELGIKDRDMRQMEKELSVLKKTLKGKNSELEKTQFCAIELEREKGRLAGVLASQKTLREHVVKIESEIAARESALLEAANELDRVKKDKDLQTRTASEKIQNLEVQLKTIREEKNNLRDTFRKERQENIVLRSEVEESSNGIAELMKKLSVAETEIKQLQEKLNNGSSEAKRYRSALEGLKESFAEEQTERESLQKRLEALLEQETAKDRIAESLEWEVGRRTKEVDYLKEQMRVMEERQQLEMENLKTALQVSRSETTSLRSELSEARKAKCTYQTKTFELKDSLLSVRRAAESLKQQLFLKRQEMESLIKDVLASRSLPQLQEDITKKRETMLGSEKTEEDVGAASNMSIAVNMRPISSLQECMSSLRSQISNLQKQMNDHTDSVQTATTTWRSFKENVHQLQASRNTQSSQQLTAEKDT
ncbi:golgin subfamily A member 3-like [Stylophora pistillata]|nr:golgin subfamily A member 3-like [Stylophora pistillata]XP_022798436.1 golgin subfamily A member 3-like [Stylophora pistillata]PFX11833.1 Golgin subfamily A member 3 [Stylophora pistillata]